MRMSNGARVGAVQGAGILLGVVAPEAIRTRGWTMTTPHSVSALISISALLASSAGVIAGIVSFAAFLVVSRRVPSNATVVRLRQAFVSTFILGLALVPLVHNAGWFRAIAGWVVLLVGAVGAVFLSMVRRSTC